MPLNDDSRSSAVRLEQDSEQPQTVEEYQRQEQILSDYMSVNYSVVERSALLDHCPICFDTLMRPHPDLCRSMRQYHDTRVIQTRCCKKLFHCACLGEWGITSHLETNSASCPNCRGPIDVAASWLKAAREAVEEFPWPIWWLVRREKYNSDLVAGKLSSSSGNGQAKKQTAVRMVPTEFEVEEILDMKDCLFGSMLVQAKWKGQQLDSAWHNIDNFKKAPLVLTDYYRRFPQHRVPVWLGEEVTKFLGLNRA